MVSAPTLRSAERTLRLVGSEAIGSSSARVSGSATLAWRVAVVGVRRPSPLCSQSANTCQPRPGHVVGRVEAGCRVALERTGQELDDRAAHLGVDRLDQQRRPHVGGQVGRVAATVAPVGGLAGRHLVDGDRRRVALRGQVVALP